MPAVGYIEIRNVHICWIFNGYSVHVNLVNLNIENACILLVKMGFINVNFWRKF